MHRNRGGGAHPSSRASAAIQPLSAAHASGSVVSYAALPAAAAYTTALKGGGSETETANEGNSHHRSEHSSAHSSLAHGLIPDLPLLMHGSGDVLPEEVHPHSVATLAKLIEEYVSSLVSAAMDAHDVFTDGEVVGGGACLGVPPYGASGAGGERSDDDCDSKRKSSGGQSSSSRLKRRRKIDYWDVPLPPPRDDDMDGNSSCGGDSDVSDDESDDDAPLISQSGPLFRRSNSSSSSAANASAIAEAMSEVGGFAAVDIHADGRARGHYVSAPSVMDHRSFIFPVCHDALLYQRVKEVQASRRSIGRDLVDGTLMEVMKEEGANIGRWGVVDMWDAVLGGRAGDGEGDEDPGDKKKGGDRGDEKDKPKGADKKKETDGGRGEKKNENGDGMNMVGAGLVDADVDPSWPGLNALSRSRLW